MSPKQPRLKRVKEAENQPHEGGVKGFLNRHKGKIAAGAAIAAAAHPTTRNMAIGALHGGLIGAKIGAKHGGIGVGQVYGPVKKATFASESFMEQKQREFCESLQKEVKRQRIREVSSGRAVSASGKVIGQGVKSIGKGVVGLAKHVPGQVMNAAKKHPKLAVGAAVGGAVLGTHLAHKAAQPKPQRPQYPGY